MRHPIETLLSLRTMLLLAVVFFVTSALASPTLGITEGGDSMKIILRQVAAPAAPLAVPEACAQYSRVANLSAIGTNSTIRSAFLQASPVGTLFNAALLNKMQASAVALSTDVQLNQACGNLTAVALQEVGVNFTMGVVGQFTFTENPVSIVNGPVVCIVTALALVLLLLPASAV